MKKSVKKQTLLLGEGVNQHTLYGDFNITNDVKEFQPITVKSKSELKHEKPDGSWSDEHKTLLVSSGGWVLGRQVEYHPMSRTVSQVFD
jgi:hypothetical protein